MHAFAGQPRLPDMDKKKLLRLITEKLAADLEVAVRAAQTAHETATHEENVAENKYDTLGLEAAYLAAGQSRRVEEIRQALGLYRNLVLRDFDEEQGIQLTALVTLLNADGSRRTVFLGPEAAGLEDRLRRSRGVGHHASLATGPEPGRQAPGRRDRGEGLPLAVEILAVD